MWVALIASFSTVMPIVLFMAGLARVGPSTAAIASTVEPARRRPRLLVLGETLGPLSSPAARWCSTPSCCSG